MTAGELRRALERMCVYRGLLEEEPLAAALELLSALERDGGEEAARACAALFYRLRQAGFSSLGEWLAHRLRYDEGPYPLLMEAGGEDPVLAAAARRDVETLAALAQSDLGGMAARCAGVEDLPPWPTGAPFSFDALTAAYRTGGAGQFARFRAFLWERGRLVPVEDPDCGGEDELIGYEAQREQLTANTRALVEGRAVNNALLYGQSGTGKSAAVKSLLSVPGLEDLRLIEADKNDLAGLPRLIRALGRRGGRFKFVLFIDDLAFDRDDGAYSALKTILEGGVERRPANVAVYATSNRRRLVRQTLSDRQGDELDAKETIEEKTALSERFGLRLAYLPMSRAEYLDLVERLARREGVAMDRERLRAAAIRWEAGHPGFTPRTARQFLAGLGAPGTAP